MTSVEVAPEIAPITGYVFVLCNVIQSIGFSEIRSDKSGFVYALVRKYKLLVPGKFFPTNQDSYAGHMTSIEVAPEIAPITGNVFVLCNVIQSIGSSEIPSRKSGFVRGSHDLRRGGTRNRANHRLCICSL
ncbi:hypothetical protein V1478_016252 [Vespula squamosa]|uniref:Uncharacterized protein n=1 Tax=Vespula squamosa TaxID=30214 RepID=A0ABD2A1P1_VESSQ